MIWELQCEPFDFGTIREIPSGIVERQPCKPKITGGSRDQVITRRTNHNLMAATAEEIKASSYVGFDSITRQIKHKLLERGFQFNIIVVGLQEIAAVFLRQTLVLLDKLGSGNRPR